MEESVRLDEAVKATRRDAVMDKLEASLRNFEACTQRNHTYRWTREKYAGLVKQLSNDAFIDTS
jgi:hypothetical protein